jgi:hypothetical protein
MQPHVSAKTNLSPRRANEFPPLLSSVAEQLRPRNELLVVDEAFISVGLRVGMA